MNVVHEKAGELRKVFLTVVETGADKSAGDIIEMNCTLHCNDDAAGLIAFALANGEGCLTASGAITVRTGLHTGRSAADKFVVRDELTDKEVWWDNNKPLAQHHFDLLFADMMSYARGRTLYSQDLFAGASESFRLPVRVYCEFAWHALFIRHLLIRPGADELAGFSPHLTIIDLPGFKADPERHGVRSETIIACDFSRRLILIGGTSYAGEIKKSVFTYLNYLLPTQNVMPMHCSVNDGGNGPAVFFGLSGTGKTTLSADPERVLIGDDEHGWSAEGLFNFEGGCYAKVIRLSPEAEPQIHAAVNRPGAVLENVVVDPASGLPDFDDGSLTENTRAAYPLHYIDNASSTGCASHPRSIIMLTADAFGVLPPIARLTPSQAMYHFLSGYTAKVAGTEKGVTEPQATFSTCFGAPFMPRHPSVYGNLLRKLIAEHQVECWLVNTGWTGGRYGVGRRISLKDTRALLAAALGGALGNAQFRIDPIFGFEVPLEVPDVDPGLLDPRKTWADAAAYDKQAVRLAGMFAENFTKFERFVDEDVRLAGPLLKLAAE